MMSTMPEIGQEICGREFSSEFVQEAKFALGEAGRVAHGLK